MLVEQVDALHHLHKGGATLFREAVFVVELLGAVDTHPHQPVVLLEEPAPAVGEQRAVGLNAVLDDAAASVLCLQLHHLLVKIERAHQRFASVPGEENMVAGLALDILFDEFLQQALAHDVTGGVVVEFRFLGIVAVGTSQVADRSHRLGHDIHDSVEGRIECLFHKSRLRRVSISVGKDSER